MSVADDLPETTQDDRPTTLGSGVRFAWGRSGDAYSIWRNRDGKVVAAFDGDQGETSARVGFQALETVARRRRRRLQAAAACVVLLLVGAAVAGAVLTRSGAPSNADGTDAPSPRFRDPGGAYTFLYPAGWDVSDGSGKAVVTSPDGAVEVTVALTVPGDPTAVAQGTAVASVQGWTHTSIEDPQYRDLGTLRAASVSGTGRAPDGTPQRLVTFVVPRAQGNLAVTIVVRADADPGTTTPGIERIVSTFRLL
jgi:hypothetical protein